MERKGSPGDQGPEHLYPNFLFTLWDHCDILRAHVPLSLGRRCESSAGLENILINLLCLTWTPVFQKPPNSGPQAPRSPVPASVPTVAALTVSTWTTGLPRFALHHVHRRAVLTRSSWLGRAP